MKARELANLGVPKGDAMRLAIAACAAAAKAARGVDRNALRETIRALLADPGAFESDPIWGPLAEAVGGAEAARRLYVPREQPAPWRQWGDDLEPSAVEQIRNACKLPVAVSAALMPDAHQGYGLPIGGVLAADDAVIPYAVGVDIACRMKLSVLDLPVSALAGQRGRLANAREAETFFGVGAGNHGRRQHAVMDEDWSVTPVTAAQKDRAAEQVGTSGSGNHFVEFGTLTLDRDDLGLAAGVYVALLSHSGSRGTGAQVAQHYSKLAMSQHPELPKELLHLAWLGLDSQEGQEYWLAMELMGRYAAKRSFTWSDARKFLAARSVELLSAGLDEVPMAYKDIETVMAAQADLVEPVARFDPRLVKMAPAGERPED